VNAVGEFGWTAVHAAAFQGLNDVIEMLAAKGAKLDVKDSFGQTPLSIAYGILTKDLGDAFYQGARVVRQDTADLLLKLGATPLEQSGVELEGRPERKNCAARPGLFDDQAGRKPAIR
jgi:Ankyrin repeat